MEFRIERLKQYINSKLLNKFDETLISVVYYLYTAYRDNIKANLVPRGRASRIRGHWGRNGVEAFFVRGAISSFLPQLLLCVGCKTESWNNKSDNEPKYTNLVSFVSIPIFTMIINGSDFLTRYMRSRTLIVEINRLMWNLYFGTSPDLILIYIDIDEILQFLYFLKCDFFTASHSEGTNFINFKDIDARAKCDFAK